ncbi:uncharacterized protein LOC143305505 isoform X1 [Osmia lignaria lignaria]|uniref:uncharacterized protein LOC143305505 isoform X1 n=2 Tax=Osmia lignaria lignaria TaxID=1437193 RepID=UPI00402BA2FE
MENRKQMVPGENNSDGKEDDDVSVIAIIEKENDRSLRHEQTEKTDEKQENRRVIEDKKYKEDSDYVRDSTETSSGASTSGGGVSKIRRVYRAVRKTHSVTEVRRNPIRAKKKDPDKNFPRLRQRLLAAKKKEMLFSSEDGKRGKSSTKPYMNTRSVTRKMYNVGATYQAPTMKDALEWKEWPVHGMHERPVFHPQLGLAAEYLGRYFTSFDGLSYCEIINRPEIEVVSVDPHCDSLHSSFEKKRSKKSKSSRSFTNIRNSKDPSEKVKSFESCMHESFHCVLGYCSQVMTPTYKTNVEGKLDMLNEKKNSSTVVKETPKQSNIVEQTPRKDSPNNSKENLQKPIEENRMDNYTAVMMPQNAKNFNQIPKTQLFPAQKVYLANSQKSIAFANMKTLQGGQVKIQDAVRPSKNPFILVNTSDIKDTRFVKSTPSTVNTKAEDTIVGEENLGELSSIYKHFDLSEQFGSKKAPTKREKKVEFAMTRYLLNTAKHTKIQIPNAGEGKLYYEIPCKGLKVKSPSTTLNKTCYSNEATEIAKILSEYNKNTTKKPASENASFCPGKNTRVNELSCKDENTSQNSQETCIEKNTQLTFSHGKWRRFHLTMGKARDLKSIRNEEKLLPNRQSLFRINPTGLRSSPGGMIEVSKHLELLQRRQTNVENVEEKKRASATSDDVDSTAPKMQYLQELLEDTAMLYCAATGTHQDDLANYIDTLDAVQSVQWLESCKNSIT